MIHLLAAQAVVHPDLALACHVHQNKFGVPVGMLAAHHGRIAAIDVEHTLDGEGNIPLAFHHDQAAPLVAQVTEAKQLHLIVIFILFHRLIFLTAPTG